MLVSLYRGSLVYGVSLCRGIPIEEYPYRGCSCTCVGHGWSMFGPCSGHVLGVAGACVEHACAGDVLAVCWTCVGQVLDTRWPYVGHVLDMLLTCFGHVWNVLCWTNKQNSKIGNVSTRSEAVA